MTRPTGISSRNWAPDVLTESLAALPEDTRGLALLSLYELVDGLDEFCEWLGIEPDDPDAIALWDITHQSYAETWNRVGNDEFEKLMKQHRQYLS